MRVDVFAPSADRVVATLDDGSHLELTRHGERWHGDVSEGTRYRLVVEGRNGRMDRARGLVDPSATAVWFPSDHSRDRARPGAGANHEIAPSGIAQVWPAPRPSRRTTRPLVVYEAHVKGMTRRRETENAGTFLELIDEVPRLAQLGMSVIELLPVHQFDPDEANYWGYMPLVFGAVHRQYAAGEDANLELAELVVAAHDHDVEVWLDVVFNHTTEEDEHGPTYNLRALADDEYYVLSDDGSYVDDAGCGNILDASSAASQRLVMMALDRFADLGIDGFRFDLATVLARDPDFVRSIGDWASRRNVRLIAEPWDVTRYQVGRAWPDQRWMQWNDRFRDDMRGFLRGEDGLVGAVMLRLQGSPDLFDRAKHSINFITSHDGFTMYDLVAYDRKRNLANGWNGADGTDSNRSWNCGWEGDEGVPEHVMAVRRRQLRNAWTLLLLSHGTPMCVAGDEFARTQGGNNNPYNQDNETSWIDWSRRDQWIHLETFVRGLTELRSQYPVLNQDEWWGRDVEWYGTNAGPDLASHSRSLAWHLPGLYVMVNMWWEPLEFAVQAPGEWRRTIDTATESGFVAETAERTGVVRVEPRSIVVLTSVRA